LKLPDRRQTYRIGFSDYTADDLHFAVLVVKEMRFRTILTLVAYLFAFRAAEGESCKVIRGRAETFSATGNLRIWEVGTDHTYFATDQKSTKLIEQYLHYPESDGQALFADFEICPTEALKKGFAQKAIVKQIRRGRIAKR
jgi:hypothetical protein